jgi:uncharacterized membrane protein YdcZ (DUF606 family)
MTSSAARPSILRRLDAGTLCVLVALAFVGLIASGFAYDAHYAPDPAAAALATHRAWAVLGVMGSVLVVVTLALMPRRAGSSPTLVVAAAVLAVVLEVATAAGVGGKDFALMTFGAVFLTVATSVLAFVTRVPATR